MKRVALLVAIVTAVVVVVAQPPLTSDPDKAKTLPTVNPGIYPGRAAVFQAPQTYFRTFLHTNERPLVVEQVISSNVMRYELWWDAGVCHTDMVLRASNVLSRTTNTVEAQ